MNKISFPASVALMSLAITSTAAAADLAIVIPELKTSEGMVSCTIYASTEGFPMDGSKGVQKWLPADSKGIRFNFKGLTNGSYAIAVFHDLNGNRILDTNLIGIPSEDWGVSNNVRPGFRAPKYDEAKFDLTADQSLEVRLDR